MIVIRHLAVANKVPFQVWIESLDVSIVARIQKYINRLKVGNFSNTKSVGDGVFELKCDFGSGYRIYFGWEGDTVVIILLGGDKQTQQTDIKRAKKYWSEYNENK